MSENNNKITSGADAVVSGAEGAVATWLVPLVVTALFSALGALAVALYNFNGTVTGVVHQLAAQAEHNTRDDAEHSELRSLFGQLDSRCDRGEVQLGQLRILCTTANSPTGAGGGEWSEWPFD